MKRNLVILAIAALLVGATAAGLAKEPPPKPLVPYPALVRGAEAEPNDDCGTANPLALGDPLSAAIGVAGDVDWFEFTAAAGQCVIFETHPGEGQVGGDTQMTLFADDCTTQLDYDDDGGDGLYSRFQHEFAAAGTYYVYINEYGNNGTIDAYVLTADECPPPPPNDDCSGAIDLQVQGLATFEIDLCDYAPDYTPAPPECTNDYPANGPDALYKIYLAAGEHIFACESPSGTYIDLSIWLVSDCGDPENTCVAGDDSGNPECVDYTAAADGWYYLIVDTYSGCGLVTVTVEAPVGAEDISWGAAKALYR